MTDQITIYYEAKKRTLKKKIDYLMALVDQHGQNEEINWSHVGDMSEAMDQLSHIISFMEDES